MKKILKAIVKTVWTLLFIAIFFAASGQSNDTVTYDEDLIIDFIEEPPSFPGGQEELDKYIKKNLRKQGVEGRVFVEFWIEKEGQIENVKVIRGLCEPCDKEVLRLVSEMPKWTPAKQRDKPIRMRMVLPIKFGFISHGHEIKFGSFYRQNRVG